MHGESVMMRRKLAGVVLLVMGLAGSAGAQHGHGGPPPAGPAPSGFEAALQDAMASMVKAMETAPMTGEPDTDFMAMMIPHHEGAVEMARLVLLHGRDPLVRQLAGEIIASQQVEIAAMQRRLAILRAGRDPDPGGFPALGGTRGPVGPGPVRPGPR